MRAPYGKLSNHCLMLRHSWYKCVMRECLSSAERVGVNLGTGSHEWNADSKPYRPKVYFMSGRILRGRDENEVEIFAGRGATGQ